MADQILDILTPAGILAMNPDEYREIDGVVFDRESYQRHIAQPSLTAAAIAPQHTESTTDVFPSANTPPADTGIAQPISAEPAQGVFPCNPVHIGWYQAEGECVNYPIMGGAVHYAPIGSGSGSYVSSFLTSYFITSGSWHYGSGSFLSSGSFSGSGLLGGGYGLWLI